MKKIGNFLLSLIMPRRMAKYRNMHWLLALVLFLVAMFIATGSQSIMSETFVRNEMARVEYKDTIKSMNESNPAQGLHFFNMQKISFTGDNDQAIDENDSAKITSEMLEEKFLNLETNRNLVVTLAFDYNFSYDATNLSKIKFVNKNLLTDYYSNLKETRNASTDYLFYFFTKDGLYYVYNMDTTNDVPDNNLTIFETFKRNIKTYEDGQIDGALEHIRKVLVEKINVLEFVKELNLVISKHDNTFNKTNNIKQVESTGIRKGYELYSETYFETLGIYHKVTYDTSVNNKTKYLDFTLVIDQKFDLQSSDTLDWNPTYFDYEGYLKQTRKDDTTYVLCFFTADRFFFVYDLAQKVENGKYTYCDYSNESVFLKTDNGNYKYFLPAKAEELKYNQYGELDTTLWTKEVSKDDLIDLSNFGESDLLTEDELMNLKPVNRHKEYFYDATYTQNSRSYLYSDMVGSIFTDKTISRTSAINNMLQTLTDVMISIDASNYELVYGLMAFAVIVLFPLLMALIIWLMSRKLVMKKFRQYYAIGSICYIMTSLISFVLGFFFAFDSYILYLMLFQAWFFIFVTFRINTDPQYNTPDDDNNDDKVIDDKEEKLDFKDIKTVKTSEIG